MQLFITEIVNCFIVQNNDIFCLNCKLILLKKSMRLLKNISASYFFVFLFISGKIYLVESFTWEFSTDIKIIMLTANKHLRIYAWNLRFHHFDCTRVIHVISYRLLNYHYNLRALYNLLEMYRTIFHYNFLYI